MVKLVKHSKRKQTNFYKLNLASVSHPRKYKIRLVRYLISLQVCNASGKDIKYQENILKYQGNTKYLDTSYFLFLL